MAPQTAMWRAVCGDGSERVAACSYCSERVAALEAELKAKDVEKLKKEIDVKECTLEIVDGQVFRCCGVVKVVIRQPRRARPRYLACYQQTLEDGRVRERDQLPSAKMHAGEAVSKAASRCLSEEFSEVIKSKDVHVIESELVVRCHTMHE